MNLTIEQKKKILDNAPTGATHYDPTSNLYIKALNGWSYFLNTGDEGDDGFWSKYITTDGALESPQILQLEDLLADVITHEATEEEMKNIDSILVESDEALATEMSERDIPSFDDPIFGSQLDECASSEADNESISLEPGSNNFSTFNNGDRYGDGFGGEVVFWDGKGLPPIGVECDIYCAVNPTLPDGDKDWMRTEIVAVIDCGFGAEETVVYKTKWSAQWYVDAHPSSSLKFRKIESPQEKAKRERLESAYDLYCDWCLHCEYAKFSFSDFCETMDDKKIWLSIVDKTGYRKEK